MNTDGAPRDLDYLTHLAADSARFVEVLAQTRPQTPVPTCPGWDADDLLWHLGQVQWFWAAIIGRGLTAHGDVEDLDNGGRPGDRNGLLAFYGAASGSLHHNLAAASPDQAAWTWSKDQTVRFIRRRQAHEALIHRIDAELTAGDRAPMDADLSTDGVDEVLHLRDTEPPSWGRFTPDPTQTVRVLSTDTGRSWLLTLGQLTGIEDDGTAHDRSDLLTVAVSDTGEASAATISGAAADLDCWLWHRPTLGQVGRAGDPLVLDRLDRSIAAGAS
jgi:uncharacterized protein (TIGR03083 family)